MIDIHSHILPGVDDGAKTLADSVEIVRELVAQGVTDIVATPHYVDETIYMSPRKENARLLDELRRELSREKVEVNLYLGNEIYICGKIGDLTKNNRIASLNDSGYILVELPMSGEYPNYEDIFRDLMREGYHVVLAHPERYAIAQEDFQVLQDLYDMGVLFQCNLGSFLGLYGKREEKLAARLAKNGMIFGFGSDTHRCHGDERITKAIKRLRKYYSEDELEQLLVQNPRKVIENQ